MKNESFDWNKVVQEFHGTFEKTFATSKKAHFDCVPLPLRVVDGARSRWSSLILIDAVIYLLDNEEFNSTSRRAYNQQQVLYDCIVRELQRSCPSLYGRHLAARLESGGVCHTNNAINFVPLKAPWCNAAQLKRHLLSDPTSKSREKFVGIIQSLFEHAAFASADGSLVPTFQKVVAKVVYEFKGIPLQPVSGLTESLPSESSSVSSASSKRVLPARKRRASPVKHELDSDSENEVDNGENDKAVTCKKSSAESRDGHRDDSAVDHPPPRKLRYVTRSSTDGYRTGTATVNGTTYHCKYVVDKRTVPRMRPLLRVGMHLTQDCVVTPADPDADSVEPSHECFFDPSLFDDQNHVPCESELDSWDFLDDWAWQQSAGPSIHLFTPLSAAARPAHPLPLPGAGRALSGQPMVHVSHSELAEFRSIAHPTVSALDSATLPVSFRSPSPALSEGPCSPVTVDSLPQTGSFRFTPFAEGSDFTRVRNSVPFPDPSIPSIYSRRAAFFRPVTPDGPIRHASSGNDELHPHPPTITVVVSGSDPAPVVPAAALPSPSQQDFHEAVGNTARSDRSDARVDPPCAASSTLTNVPYEAPPVRDPFIQAVEAMPARVRVCNLVSATSSQDLQCLHGMGKLEVCERDEGGGPLQRV